jgi:ubiquinol-cytochrome c reductase iron-sulfur subunit
VNILWRGLRFLLRALLAVVLGRRAPKGRPRPELEDPSEREVTESRRAETLVAVLMIVASLCFAGFVVFYVVYDDTQLLGLTIGLALALLAAAAVIAGKRIVPQETEVEERVQLLRPEEVERVDEIFREGGEGISRRKLLAGAGAAAGISVGAALIVPAASFGPNIDGHVKETPWIRGRRLVDDESKSYRPEEIEIGTFYTAFPDGADPDQLGSSLVVVKLPEDQIHLPADRSSWAPEGVLAFSKICPHAGCAISLYRYPLYEPTSAKPALTCPCHYSTFDPATGG